MSAKESAKRVVITGLGVIAPNANGVADFEMALRKGRSGLKHQETMAEAKYQLERKRHRRIQASIIRICSGSGLFVDHVLLIGSRRHRHGGESLRSRRQAT